MKKPEVDPEIERQQKIARQEKIKAAQVDLTQETDELQRLFGQRAATGSMPRGLVGSTGR